MRLRTLIYFSLIIFFGCVSKDNKQGEAENSTFYSIDCSKMIKTSGFVDISEFAENLVYVPLETSSASTLGRIFDAKFTKDYIFIHHDGPLAQFDRSGKFIRNIGTIGRGPAEYLLIRSFSIDEAKELIYIQSNWTREILVFSFKGEFVKSIELNLDDRAIVWSRDSLFMCFKEPQAGNEEYVFREINTNGDILQTVKNYSKWQDKPAFGSSNVFWGRNIFYRFNNKLHFKGEYNDTVYTYDSNNRIVPKFFLDLKEYTLPVEMRIEKGYLNKVPAKYYWACVRETLSYIFIRFATYTGNKEESWYADEGYAFVDKSTRNWRAIKNKDENSGFINDLDGGPDFVPEYTNDTLAFHFIRSIDLKKHLSSDKFKKSNPKYLDKKETLINQFQVLKENDNDVLMIVKLKQPGFQE